jgi:FAD binding domain
VTAIQTSASTSLNGLRRRFRGTIVEPGGPEWAAATQAFNLAFTQQPTIVALPADAEDVRTLVEFAWQTGLQLAPQRTGHNAEPLGALGGVILVKTDLLQGVAIDVNERVARVRSGAKWGALVPHASDLGLAALHAPRRTSASRATRSAAASAGTRASSGSPRTASPRSSW